jgi:hypothetical protein
VKIVQKITSVEDQQKGDEEFDHEPQRRRKTQYVVHRSDIEHDHHGHNHDQHPGIVHNPAHADVTDDDAEEYGDTAQNRDRPTLQLPAVGNIHEILHQRDLDQTGMDPTDNQQRDYQGQ